MDMALLRGEAEAILDEFAGACHFAERPQDQREINHRRNTDILTEAIGEVTIALRIVNGNRLLEMAARRDVVTLKPVGHAVDPVSYAKLRASLVAGCIGQEC